MQDFVAQVAHHIIAYHLQNQLKRLIRENHSHGCQSLLQGVHRTAGGLLQSPQM
jgi:hypothetical protein